VTLYLATKNKNKLREIKEIFSDLNIDVRSAYEVVDPSFDVEETGNTFEENAKLKADALSAGLDGYVIADDSGLCVDALNGRPGVHSARFAGKHASDEANNLILMESMEAVKDKDRTARFVCVIALSKGGVTEKTFRGECEGRIGRYPVGKNGFGYDPLMLLPDGRSMAQLSPGEKNRISHRAKAIEALRAYLAEKG
jgi:XTP/dITP diphosphohydrolase